MRSAQLHAGKPGQALLHQAAAPADPKKQRQEEGCVPTLVEPPEEDDVSVIFDPKHLPTNPRQLDSL